MAIFQFSEEEYRRALLRVSRRRIIRSFCLFIVAIALIAASFLFRGDSPGVVLIYSLEGFVLLCVVIGFRVWRQAANYYRQQPAVQSVLNVSIDDQQLSYTWARGSYIMPWTN